MFGKSEEAEDYQRVRRPVAGMGINIRGGTRFGRHVHRRGQLLFTASGVLVVAADAGTWVVPPLRAVWVPAGVEHTMRAVGKCAVRTLWVAATQARELPRRECAVVSVSPLLRELIVEAARVPVMYKESGRDGLVMKLLLAELRVTPVRALHLPMPMDERALEVARAVLERPGSGERLGVFARKAYVSEKTLGRIFLRETGMTFGRWRQQARVLASLAMLASGKAVLNVAMELGYGSPSAFAVVFRRAMGVAPSRYFADGG